MMRKKYLIKVLNSYKDLDTDRSEEALGKRSIGYQEKGWILLWEAF